MTTNQQQDAKLLAESADRIRGLLAPVADLEALALTPSPFAHPAAGATGPPTSTRSPAYTGSPTT